MMVAMRNFAKQELNKTFPNTGNDLENIIYEYTMEKTAYLGCCGMDFYPFRNTYKERLQSILLNINDPSSDLKNFLNDILHTDSTTASNTECDETMHKAKSDNKYAQLKDILTCDIKKWNKNLWNMEEDVPESTAEPDELREGTFDCMNCAKKGLYSKNTTHYEKQTRSADEPMTVFCHCHTCGKDYRFSS
jgi:DNA-directed RNA polymerase subunit M/transcription elongation factor TFIIS